MSAKVGYGISLRFTSIHQRSDALYKPANDTRTDEELLSLFKKDGNSQWLGTLLERYTLLIFGTCVKYLKSRDDAKDATQHVFEKVLKDAGRYEISFFKSWLYMVTKNHCLLVLREQSKVRFQSDASLEAHHNNEDDGDDFTKHRISETMLNEALASLKEDQQKSIRMFYLQKQSYQKIMELTGWSNMQVKSNIQNGKRNLKIALEKMRENAG